MTAITSLGTKKVRLFLPSRTKEGGLIDEEILREWEGKVRGRMEALFGGCTPFPVIGSYTHEDGRVTREKIVNLEANCPKACLTGDKRQSLQELAAAVCRELRQECVFLGWGDEAFLVSADREHRQVATIPFRELPRDSWTKYLTMGWGGVDEPQKAIQLLSLDGWRPFDEMAEVQDAWKDLFPIGELEEGDSIRRAWAASVPLRELQDRIKGKRRGRGRGGIVPRAGDLLFLPGREPSALEVGLFGDRGRWPKALRTLRTSQGRLNPVTRDLLLRMLCREWDEFAEDLEKEDVNNQFYQYLADLQMKLEAEIARQLGGARKKLAYRLSVLVIARMMALRFLAEKGTIPNGTDRLTGLFDRFRNTYYRDVIRPLWFEVLSKPPNMRDVEVVDRIEGSGRMEVPYLNGGLFCERDVEKEIDLPSSLFDPGSEGSFLWLFQRFEFALNEYWGSDEVLKVDPSLLGNMLEHFNAGVERKVRGVHYTPKGLAAILALEGIAARLAYLTGIERSRILDLATQGAGSRALRGSEAARLQVELENLRIIDPAAGSGALLWECLEVLLALDSACDGIAGNHYGYHRGSYRWGQRARYFVLHCLFGVDIQDEAVELTKLRLLLAVALSQGEPSLLPSLEFNIVRANSIRPISSVTWRLQEREQDVLAGKLGERFRNYERALREYLDKWCYEANTSRPPDGWVTKQRDAYLAELKKKIPVEFMDWAATFPTVYGDQRKRGFDLVIANPPYVRIQRIEKAERERYRKTWISMGKGNVDLWQAFVEMALRGLAAPDRGQVAFIVPDIWRKDATKELLKILFVANKEVRAALRRWVDFGDRQVFPTATTYVGLLFAERLPPGARKPESFDYHENVELPSVEDPEGVRKVLEAGRRRKLTLDDRKALTEVAPQSRRTRLEGLAEICVGIQTSADRVFLFDEARPVGSGHVELRGNKRSPCIVEAAMVRRCKKGARKAWKYLLFPYTREGRLLDEDELAARYPRAWSYLQSKKEILEKREKGRFRGARWYRYGRSQGVQHVCRPKLVVPALVCPEAGLDIVVDAKGELAYTASGAGGGGCWGVFPREKGVTLEFLARQLRQKSVLDLISRIGQRKKNGWRGIDRRFLAQIPCKAPAG